jgi:hypothetical protein
MPVRGSPPDIVVDSSCTVSGNNRLWDRSPCLPVVNHLSASTSMIQAPPKRLVVDTSDVPFGAVSACIGTALALGPAAAYIGWIIGNPAWLGPVTGVPAWLPHGSCGGRSPPAACIGAIIG